MTEPPPSAELGSLVGDIDIYLFDQLLRGRFDRRPRVLDAGCGDGRNLRYLISRGFTCYAVDRYPVTVEGLPADRIVAAEIDRLPWGDASMDVVICSAVLHFAQDAAHFGRMVVELWRVLASKGLFFARLASNIGLEPTIGRAGTRVRLPDGSDRFVVDERMLLEWTSRLGGRLADPIKTTIVQGQRCMTTWVVLK
jgi:SAM-dependent methyltransferase